MSIFVIFLGVVVYVFGYVMGLICASKKRRDKGTPPTFVEPCETLEDILKREG